MTVLHVSTIPADISYFLDCATQSLHISPDTYSYCKFVAGSETTAFIDRFGEDYAGQEFERHWNRLTSMGLGLESNHISWRFLASEAERQDVSFAGVCNDLTALRDEFVHTFAHELADHGFSSLTPAARERANHSFGYETALEVVSRYARRVAADLGGVDLHDLRMIGDRITQSREKTLARHVAEVKSAIVKNPDMEDTEFNDLIENIPYTEVKAIKTWMANKNKSNRSVIKRSIKFAQKLIGNEPTRLFLGSHKIRFEGEHAIYELVKTGSVLSGHGGSQLRLYDKKTDEHLCNVCIYTPGVPILDHVASIALHIQAGNEIDLLNIGNLYGMTPAGNQSTWLAPYLPKTSGILVGDVLDRIKPARGSAWKRRSLMLKKHLTQQWADAIAPMWDISKLAGVIRDERRTANRIECGTPQHHELAALDSL